MCDVNKFYNIGIYLMIRDYRGGNVCGGNQKLREQIFKKERESDIIKGIQ